MCKYSVVLRTDFLFIFFVDIDARLIRLECVPIGVVRRVGVKKEDESNKRRKKIIGIIVKLYYVQRVFNEPVVFIRLPAIIIFHEQITKGLYLKIYM